MAKMGTIKLQCPVCSNVQDESGKWFPSIVMLPKIPKELCYPCKKDAQEATESPRTSEKPQTAPEAKKQENDREAPSQPQIRRDENLTDLQTAALRVIGTHTKGSEVTGKDIANTIGLKPRSTGKEGADMRSIINALRKKGYPVCANGKGYYWPTDRQEIVDYMESLEGRIRKEQEALAGMHSGMDAWDAGHQSPPPPLDLIEV